MLRGSKFHYRFQIEGKNYSGVFDEPVPENATPRQIESLRQKAIAFEKTARTQVVQDLCNLKEKEREIRQNKSVVALVENYKFELSGGRRIALAEALPLAEAKPAKRVSKSKYAEMRKPYWNDFTSFMESTYPEISDLSAVRRCHCEAYVSYLVNNGRYNKEVRHNITVGKRRKKVKEICYTRNYLLAPKTVKEIVGVCRWVFNKLSEDAGVVRDPWKEVVLPQKDTVDREVFTHDELQLIWEGIQHDEFCYPLFLVAANSGMTEGDICTLEWSEVDWRANCIRRDRRKTGADIILPLLPQLAEYLASLPREGRYIFPEHAELYLDEKQRSKVSSRVIRFLQGLGIKTTKEIPGRRAVSVKDLHSMRHVFCYRASRAGIPRSSIAKMVGHMDETMTQHYADHETVEDLNAEIKKLSSPFMAKESEVDVRRQLAELAYRLPEAAVRQLLESVTSATAQGIYPRLLA
jgi:integrase